MNHKSILTCLFVLVFVLQGWLTAAPAWAGTPDDAALSAPVSLATSPSWMAEGDQRYDGYAAAAPEAGDVNGDGYDDVIVGARWYDNGQVDEGRVYVYYGSASGLSSTADWMAESDQAGANFGASVDTAGDVNGDGYADVIVGASRSDQAFVFHGSAAGLPDADGDGLAHPSDADWTAQSDQLGSLFGNESSTAGDVNGDGYDEVIVAAYLYSHGQSEEGRVFLYYGSASGLSPTADWMFESDLTGAHTYANGTAGDVNGDGYADIIVGAHANRADRAFVFYGSAAGLADADVDGLAHPSDADWTVRSDQNNSRFGTSVGTAGDVNGDGYDEVIIGDNFYIHGQRAEGRAFVYYGSATGLPDADGDGVAYPSDANWMAESDQAGACFGRGVAKAGDVDGDGYAEVIVGAPYYDGGQRDEGAAFVFYGSAAGLADADVDGLAHLSDAGWSFESDQADAGLGAVATAGDVNGDGLADVATGGWGYDGGQVDGGAAFVFHGVPTNRPPIADAGGPYSGDEGSAIAITGSASSDPDMDTLTYAWSYTAGAGVDAGASCTFGDANAVSTTITCTDDGTYNLTLTVSDGTASDSDSMTVDVANVAPDLGAISVNQTLVPVGTAINASASFTDPGSNDTHTAVWDWGDGSTAGTVSGLNVGPDSHSYTTPGVYTVQLTVTDDDGGSDVSTFEFVVVYDPRAGFVTGGGWIDSPADACPDFCDGATGKANFGFVSKYKKGANTPTGQTEFQFKAGNLNFHSDSYDWLVVAGDRAQYKGKGTINGDDNNGDFCKFHLTGMDADINENDSFDVDRFRIKIWTEDNAGNETVIYDNEPSEALDHDPTTEIGGGSIVIHKAK